MVYSVSGSFWVGVDGRVRTIRGSVDGLEVVAGSEGMAADLALASAVENLAGDSVVHCADWEEGSPRVKEVPTDQVMRRIGAQPLPGFEAVL
jgi:hypothetical protein